MHDLKTKLVWPLAGLGIAAGFAAIAHALAIDIWPARFVWFLLAVALAGGPIWYFARRLAREQQAACRYLERVCQSTPRELWPQVSGDAPSLSENTPWHEVLRHVRELLGEQSRRLAELEHSRAALEIRARKAAAQADRAMNVVSQLTEPVLAVDAYDSLLLANAGARKLLGLPSADGEVSGVSRLLACEQLTTMLHDLRRHKGHASRSEEIELAGSDGAPRWYQVTMTTIPDDGERSGDGDSAAGQSVVAVLRDIHTQKAGQRTNAEFVSAASHEMKTPLAGIKAYVELLADGDAEDEATREEFLNVINGQADRLQRLIDNLLNIARIEAGVVQVSKRSQSLNDILSEAHRVVQPTAEAKRIELTSDLSPLYLGVHADRDLLLQAAINLLSNAVKYTPAGGRVTLRSRWLDPEVAFEVEDTGVGLSKEDCQRVFDKFYRVEKDKQMASGTGLGLPLAKHIVEDVHNGRLAVESELGVGSKFKVTLPGSGQLDVRTRPEGPKESA